MEVSQMLHRVLVDRIRGVLLVGFYYVCWLPAGMLVRLRTNLLDRRTHAGSFWEPYPANEAPWENALRES